METKLDRKRAAETERAQRVKNMSELSKKLDEAKGLLSVIKGNDFETIQKRQTVQRYIEETTELFEDEKRAYEATFSEGGNIDSITEKMGL